VKKEVHAYNEPTIARLESFVRKIQRPNSLVQISGKVSAINGSGISVRGLSNHVNIGDFVRIHTNKRCVLAEVLSLKPDVAQLQSLSDATGITINARAEALGTFAILPSPAWRGRIVDALAEPIDGLGPLRPGPEERALNAWPPNSMDRERIGKPIQTGIKAIDIFTPLCLGQRVGIFAGSGVGKSSLLSMLARSKQFDTTVVALVGERGREVQEFVSDTLGDSRAKSVVVVSTSDEPAARRKLVPLTATAIAESFRDMGQSVLLVMDSVTRYAHALREISLASGEPPVARGYPPSVFGKLPQLMERAGPGPIGGGSITAFYAVLVDGDNHNEPVADTVRGILDGHIVLDRGIAASGRYPAIDILASISRLAEKSWTPEEAKVARDLRKLVSRFEDTKDLRALGGYQQGADTELDRAVAFVPKLYAALHQARSEDLCADSFSAVARLTRPPAN
jgi:flagellum-specific ATP synthase